MKTGKVASNFKRDPKTIRRIVNDYHQFFTADAQKDEEDGKRTQRFFHPEDIIVINSALKWEYEGLNKEQVIERLDEGRREQELPAAFKVIDSTNAMTIYAELNSMRLLIEQRDAEIERILEESRGKDQQLADQNERIISLSREAERWKTRYEDLKERLDGED